MDWTDFIYIVSAGDGFCINLSELDRVSGNTFYHNTEFSVSWRNYSLYSLSVAKRYSPTGASIYLAITGVFTRGGSGHICI